MATSLALYLHIPFCTAKCGYCDFNSYAGLDHLVPAYTRALVREIELWAPAARDVRVDSVFFGGGTPSLTSLDDMRAITDAVRAHYNVAPDAEWTLESNPAELTEEHLAGLRAQGINRLSIGVQSLHDDELRMLDRLHSAERAMEAVAAARAAGFDNVSLDLIFGLIEQPLGRWQETLERALTLRPEHLSCYALGVEPGTPLHYRVARGELPEPDPDIAAAQYEWTRERLARADYRHYEISNWARPGSECRHNLTYWRNRSYLGVGPGAHSYLDSFRFWNLKSPREYVRLLQEGLTSTASVDSLSAEVLGDVPVVEDVERIDRRLEMAETLMMGLRLDTGIRIDDFAERFGVTPDQAYGETIEELSSIGLLEGIDGRLRLTPPGRMLGNEVFARFFAD